MLTKKIIEYFFLLTVASLPLYVFTFKIFGLPTNVSEILALFSIALFVFYKKNSLLVLLRNIPLWLKLSVTVLFLGLFSSIFYPGNFSLNGLGIIKGWFVVPTIFSFCASALLKEEHEIKKIFYTIYFSSFVVSVVSLFYLMSGNTTFDGRLSSFYSSPNQLSMFLVFSLFFFVYALYTEKKFSVRLLFVFSLIPILISLYFTFSYSVWLSIALSFILSGIIFKKVFFGKFVIPILILIIFCIFFIFQIEKNKISSIFNERSSLSSRVMIWKSSLKIIYDNPVFGIGPGNFQKKYLEYQRYFPPYLEWAVPHPHNIYLSFWIQSGIMGLFAFILIFTKTLGVIFENKKTAFSAVFAMSLGYIFLHGFVDTPVWKNDLSYIFWLIIFFGSCIKNQKSNL